MSGILAAREKIFFFVFFCTVFFSYLLIWLCNQWQNMTVLQNMTGPLSNASNHIFMWDSRSRRFNRRDNIRLRPYSWLAWRTFSKLKREQRVREAHKWTSWKANLDPFSAKIVILPYLFIEKKNHLLKLINWLHFTALKKSR